MHSVNYHYHSYVPSLTFDHILDCEMRSKCVPREHVCHSGEWQNISTDERLADETLSYRIQKLTLNALIFLLSFFLLNRLTHHESYDQYSNNICNAMYK